MLQESGLSIISAAGLTDAAQQSVHAVQNAGAASATLKV